MRIFFFVVDTDVRQMVVPIRPTLAFTARGSSTVRVSSSRSMRFRSSGQIGFVQSYPEDLLVASKISQALSRVETSSPVRQARW